MKQVLERITNILVGEDEARTLTQNLVIDNANMAEFISLVQDLSASKRDAEADRLFGLFVSKLLGLELSQDQLRHIFDDIVLGCSRCAFSKNHLMLFLIDSVERRGFRLRQGDVVKILKVVNRPPRLVYGPKPGRRALGRLLGCAHLEDEVGVGLTPTEVMVKMGQLSFEIAETMTQEQDAEALYGMFRMYYRLKMQYVLAQLTTGLMLLAAPQGDETNGLYHQLKDKSEEFETQYYSFFNDYLPVTFVASAEHRVTPRQLQIVFQEAFCIPGSPFDAFQLICERMHEVNDTERPILLRIVAEIMTNNHRLQAVVPDLLKNLAGKPLRNALGNVADLLDPSRSAFDTYCIITSVPDTPVAACGENNRFEVLQDMLLMPCHGFQTDLYYYVANLFVFEFHRAEYIPECRQILRHLVKEDSVADLCAEQLSRAFDFDNDDLALREGTLQLLTCFDLAKDNAVSRLPAIVSRFVEELTGPLAAPSFATFRVLCIFLKQLANGNDPDYTAAMLREVSLGELIHNILTSNEKKEKMDLPLLAPAMTLLSIEELRGLRNTGVEWVDRFAKAVCDNSTLCLSGTDYNNKAILEVACSGKCTVEFTEPENYASLDLGHLKTLDLEVLKKIFQAGQNCASIREYCSTICSFGAFCFTDDRLAANVPQEPLYLNAKALYLAVSDERSKQFKATRAHGSLNQYLMLVGAERQHISEADFRKIEAELDAAPGELIFECLLAAIEQLSASPLFPELLKRFQSLQSISLCIAHLTEAQIPQLIDLKRFENTQDLPVNDAAVLIALKILIKGKFIMPTYQLATRLLDAVSSNSELFCTQMRLLEELACHGTFNAEQKGLMSQRLTRHLEAATEMTRNQVRKARLAWSKK